MKINIGDYVRTKKGSIYKVDEIGEYSGNVYATDDTIIQGIIKSSPNIIDLIEVGDYVNGCYVDEILNADDCYDDRKHFHLLKFNSYFRNEDIKSIVTKEMFANAEYRVETN